MTHESRQDQLVELALGTLPEAEAMELRAHVESCPECAAYLAEVRATMGLLPLALEDVAPSADVRQRVLERARPPATAERRVVWWPLVAAAAVLVISGLVFFVSRGAVVSQNAVIAQFRQADARKQEELEVLRADVAARDATLAEAAKLVNDMRSQLVANSSEIERLATRLTEAQAYAATLQQENDVGEGVVAAMQAEQPLIIALAATENAGDGEAARILLDVPGKRWYLFTTGLPALEEGREYQLWFVDGQTPVGVDTFTVEAGGKGLLYGAIPENVGDYELAAITDEPAGGSPQPTTPIRVAGSLK